MKAVTGEVMQRIDHRTISEHGISGRVLMENAGAGTAATIHARSAVSGGRTAVIVAGKGNNGGDGFVVARHLKEAGWQVKVLVFAPRNEINGDALANLDLLDACSLSFEPQLHLLHSEIEAADVVVDALFGTGLKSEVRGTVAEAIDLINGSGKPVCSVDIPSGIDARTGKVLGTAIMATLTTTYGLAKIGHLLYPGAEHAGKLHVIDIGIPASVADEAPGVEFIDVAVAARMVRKRERTAHKGSCGHCLIVAGSCGKTGAAVMAANSAVRAGAGLVTLAVPAAVHSIVEIKTTEAMTVPLDDNGGGVLSATAIPAICGMMAARNVMAVGPGLSWNPSTASVVRHLVESATLPLIVDADGLNAISEETAVLSRRKGDYAIVTPHPGEMARLAGIPVVEVESDRIAAASSFAGTHSTFVVLKGARTIIASPDGKVAINGSGNPGMASGGMGDVLTGILAALTAQGYDPFTACRLGVFLHGHAADMVAIEKGEIGMSATDVQEMIPLAIKHILEQEVV